MLIAQIPATPAWQDGTYRCYIHDLGLPEHTVYWVNEVEIMNGDWNWKTPTTTDIATRLMGINIASHNQTGTLGASLNQMAQLVEYIATGVKQLLASGSKVTPPKKKASTVSSTSRKKKK